VSSIGVAGIDRESLTDMVWANAERFADAVSFRRRIDDSWLDVTAREFAAQVLGVAKGLIAAGMRPGDRIALLCGTRYEWPVLEFAIWAAGCVSVPVQDEDELAARLAGSGARGVVVETEAQRARVSGIPVWLLGTELTELGKGVGEDEVHRRRLAVRADDPAVLDPAGEATHRAVLGEVRSSVLGYDRLIGSGTSMLVELPLAEPLSRVLALSCVYTRTTLGLGRGLADLTTFRPTVVLAEPALLERVYESAKLKAQAEDRGRLFASAELTAVAYSTAVERTGPSLALRGKHAVASRFVYPKVRAALGGRCSAVLCVGGPASERLVHFFRGLGVAVHSV
jgi:long-chain acyl-CoA synthetase